MPDLKALLQRLLKNKLDFVLIGGFAGTVHGSTLVTQDLDICLAITEEEITKLRAALKDINPRHRMNPSFKPSFMDYPKDLTGVNNLYLETDLGVLDILACRKFSRNKIPSYFYFALWIFLSRDCY